MTVLSLFCLDNVNIMFGNKLIEGFGDGARAQMSSNRGDSSLIGSPGGDPMAANSYATSGYQSQYNNVLSPTTPQQYQQMNSRGSGNGWGSTGSPNYAGHSPGGRSLQQPQFSPHIQQQFLKYENQLEIERRKNRSLLGGWGRRYENSLGSGNSLISQIVAFIEQIFRLILGILNILIGWLF